MSITYTLKLRSCNDQVREWQRILIKDGFDLSPWHDDGNFDESTHNATVSWQSERGLEATGIVGLETVAAINKSKIPLSDPFNEDLNIKFIQAKNYQPANRNEIKWIILYSIEEIETSTTALNAANWFAEKNTQTINAHFCIDDRNIIQCIKETDLAHHVKSINEYGIGIEHVGYCRQTRDQWLDSHGIQMLKRSAKLTATLCKKWNIPVRYIDRNGLKNGNKGISTHNEVALGFENGKDYINSGLNFPIDLYITWAMQCYDELG